MIHAVKTNKKYFEEVINGNKLFSVRKNDRDYKVGDYLGKVEVDYNGNATGRKQLVKITYILQGGQYGIDKDYVIMSIEKTEKEICKCFSKKRVKHYYPNKPTRYVTETRCSGTKCNELCNCGGDVNKCTFYDENGHCK